MARQHLVFATLAAAQARSSRAQALSNGCGASDVTQFWWQVAGGSQSVGGFTPPNAIAAVLLVDGSFYSIQGLTGGEQSALQTAAQLTSAGWTMPT